MKMISFSLVATFLLLASSLAGGQLVVHEWGTFTSLQDEDGKPLGGINTDDEPLPEFVHRVADDILLLPSQAPPSFFQGAPSCHPDVTMRLETPVLYFHPPTNWKAQSLDVDISFRGGWLTEYWPAAVFRAPGLNRDEPKGLVSNEQGSPRAPLRSFGHLTAQTVGELSWKDLIVGCEGMGPATDEKVWLAPRAVDASEIKTRSGECEKFLFYRGVGHVDAPISVVRNEPKGILEIHDNIPMLAMLNAKTNLRIPAAWFVDVAENGECAFRALGPLEFGKPVRATTPSAFPTSDFGEANLTLLQGDMRTCLVEAGLFPDEADALLNTWRVSYFKSPGMRLFYICPRVEVDNLLPLKISAPSTIARVMVGRIELVTPEQRALLGQIAAGPALDLSTMRGVTADSRSDFFAHPENVANWNAVLEGKAPYSVLGLPIPQLYRTYLKLGRFRNALILDEQMRRPTPALGEFIAKNGFQAYQVD